MLIAKKFSLRHPVLSVFILFKVTPDLWDITASSKGSGGLGGRVRVEQDT